MPRPPRARHAPAVPKAAVLALAQVRAAQDGPCGTAVPRALVDALPPEASAYAARRAAPGTLALARPSERRG